MSGGSQWTAPLPRGARETKGVCVMSLATMKRLIDRLAPAALTTVMFGLVVVFAAVGVAGAV